MIFSACSISSMDSCRVFLASFGVAPVLLHLRVQEVLVDGRELAGQLLVEQGDDLRVADHVKRVLPRTAWAVAAGASARDDRSLLLTATLSG